jgi:hypothetical protein
MGMRSRFAGVVLVASVVVSCGAADPSETDVAAPNGEATGFFQEALFAGCPSSGTNICYSLAGPSGACCRCNGDYGTWRKNPVPLHGYTCACRNSCTVVSTTLNFSGMCCTCDGVKGTYVPGPSSNTYNCLP